MSVRDMLYTFHAAVHLPYAKSAQLYLQEMECPEELLPADDEQMKLGVNFKRQ